MCKKKIHMLNKLWPVMKRQNKVDTKVIMKKIEESGKTPRFFMYAANWCSNSKRAFNHIQELLHKLEDKSDHFTVVDVETNRYICPNKNWYSLVDKEKELSSDSNVQLQQLMGNWTSVLLPKQDKTTHTKPQVFVHIHPNWHYVGGANDTVKLSIAANTQASEGKASDPQRLLPMVVEGKRSSPNRLKF